ncbi:MAG TPA: D-alanyl-D-alanine carboxypeptidase family protein [Xanthobacteraceae bacterium]|jgi:D-alanyl-D-alanine carboxypeptidase (penicillin-binding protein 5/6)
MRDLPAYLFVRRAPVLAAALALLLAAVPVRAQTPAQIQVSAPHAILIDFDSGTVLYEKAADVPTPPASMSKLMTMAVVFRELKNGDLKLSDEIPISEYAWRRGGAPAGGSAMFAAIHSRVPVPDLLRGAIVQSGNDATIAFAEAIAGNELAFSEKMNALARELGLTNSTFRNASGLHDPDQKASVRDLAKLAVHIIRNYPEHYKIFGEREFTWNKIRQQSRNPLLTLSIGADGLKTGFIKESGYGIVGSAVQGGARLIVAINGARTEKDRVDDARRLIEWGFRAFDSRLLFREGATVGEARVFGGDRRNVPLVGNGTIRLLSQRGTADRLLVRIAYTGPLRAPIAQGAEVARLRVMRGNAVALDVPLYAATVVGEGSLTQRALDGAFELAGGLVRSGLDKIKR